MTVCKVSYLNIYLDYWQTLLIHCRSSVLFTSICFHSSLLWFLITKGGVCICIHCLNYFPKLPLKQECLHLCISHLVSRSCQWHTIVLINTGAMQWLPAAVWILQQSQGSLFSEQETLIPRWEYFITLTWCLCLCCLRCMSTRVGVDNWVTNLPLLGAGWRRVSSGLGAAAGSISLGAVT